MTRAVRPVVSLAVILVCVTGTMAVGTALKGPCAAGSWGDGRQYAWLCYSDIVPLLNTEQLVGTRLPFVNECATVPDQNCDEYPVLTMYFMRGAAWISGPNFGSFYYVNAAFLLLCALAIAICLYLMAGARALYFALAPTLLVYGTMNWDLLAVAFATAGLLFLLRRRDVWSGTMLGLGAAAKLYPALLVVPFIAQRLRERRPDGAVTLGWATAGAWALVNLPFLIASPTSWIRFFSFNSERPADFDSLWFIGCRHVEFICRPTRTVNVLAAAIFLAGSALVWILRARRFPDFPRWTLGFPLIVIFLLSNKVYSPQFGLWLVPWFALALPGLGRFMAFEIADVGVFVTRFWWFGRLQGGWGTPQTWFEVMVVLRALVLVWCLVAWIREQHQPLPIESIPVAAEAQPA
jgi:uncharacterized membrane protein